jgi:hypothetical protein
MTVQHHPQEHLAETRPLTYNDAGPIYPGTLLTAGRDRYHELSDRDMEVRTAAKLRELGEFDPENLGHQLVAASEPLTAAERLEHMAIGEALARHYRHPSMLDQAAKAGATWEQIGAARGTSADQARADYRAWADGQHSLLSYGDGKFGMPDADYAAAYARSADPSTYPGGIGDPAAIGILSGSRNLEAGQ